MNSEHFEGSSAEKEERKIRKERTKPPETWRRQ
jgi:hypothetical protein